MDPKNTLSLAIMQLREKKARTALTVLMVIIGVASIVALTSQTAGASQNIQKTLGSLGPTSILITPSGKTIFTSADVANLQTLQNVSSVTPIISGSATLSVNGQNTSVSVLGLTTNGLNNLLGNPIDLYQGSLYSDGLTPAALLGHSAAFSSSTNPDLQTADVGETGTLEVSTGGRGSESKISVPIVGILQSHGSSIVPIDGSVIVSLPFAEVLLDKQTFNEILVKANTPENVSKLTSLLEVIYASNARVINTQQLADTFSSIQSQTSQLFIIIAGVSLLVAAIGIMNVMLMSVSERVHDIGILKSIGFKSRDVLLIFLFQAVAIGVLGGALGLGTGVATSYLLSYTGGLSTTPKLPAGAVTAVGLGGAATGRSSSGTFVSVGAAGGGNAGFVSRTGGAGAVSISSASPSTSSTSTPIEPVFTASVIAEAMIISIVISVVAGIYPAWRASKMEPIDALRIL